MVLLRRCDIVTADAGNYVTILTSGKEVNPEPYSMIEYRRVFITIRVPSIEYKTTRYRTELRKTLTYEHFYPQGFLDPATGPVQ
eukprot:947507-Pyramimonas_sp.AAC.1